MLSNQYVETFQPHQYAFTCKCTMCENEHVITVDAPELFRYNRGAHMQDAFPHLTPDERELLISGICGSCYDNLFGDPSE